MTRVAEAMRASWANARSFCAYCDVPLVSPSNVGQEQALRDRMRTRDHWIPRSKGGRFEVGNCVWSCALCNEAKGARRFTTMAQARAVIRDLREKLLARRARRIEIRKTAVVPVRRVDASVCRWAAFPRAEACG